jgi:polyisoprenoid-binding protein YceI
MRRFVLAAAAAAAFVAPALAQTPAAPAPAPPGPNTWIVDTGHSAAGFSVRHLLVSTVRGTLGPVKGTVEYDGKSLDSIKADITIDVNGVNTQNEGRDKDLKSPNFFDVAQFPTATFKSKRAVAESAGRFKLIGDLTMHGVTKEVTLNVEGPSPVLKQPNGALKIGASATTTINRKDFGMQWNRMIESAPVASDEVQVTIDLELNRRPPTAPQL